MRKENKASPRERESRTPYVILGMLAMGPGTGYEIRERIAGSTGYFWQESYGQIYPALQRLKREGRVRSRPEARGRRVSERFEITARGRAALSAWLRRPPALQPERNELLLKVFFANLEPEAILAHIAAEEARARASLDALNALRASLNDCFANDPALPAWLATVEYGLGALAAVADWAAGQTRTLRRRLTPRR
jgi:DNA-binding PadR family transcriptional regulator